MDDIQKLFNEARFYLDALSYKLDERGYTDMAQRIRNNASNVDATQHDYTELILDPS